MESGPIVTTLATSSSYRTRFSPPIPTESHGRILPETGASGAWRSSVGTPRVMEIDMGMHIAYTHGLVMLVEKE